MKRPSFEEPVLKRSLFLLASILLGTLLSSCTSVYVPGTGNPGNPGGGGGGNPNGPVINAGIMRSTLVVTGVYPVTTVSTNCTVQLLNPPPSSGFITGASVTLIAPGNLHIPVTEISPGQYNNAGVGWTYQPGQTYTIQVVIGSTLYSGSAVAPGNITIPDFPSPGPIVWSVAGNHDSITILNPSYTITLVGPIPPAASGQVSTASSTYFASSGNYTITVSALRQVPGAFGSNAYPTNLISASDSYDLSTTK